MDEKEILISLENLRKYNEELLERIPKEQIWRGNGTPPMNTEHIIGIDYANGLMYFKNELGGWTVLSGGGGGSNNPADFDAAPTGGWLSKTVALGAVCKIPFHWYSTVGDLPTGKGTIKIAIGGIVKKSYEEEQGDIEVDVTSYLLLGSNDVEITIFDLYGNSLTYKFSITTVQVSIFSYFGEGKNSPAYQVHKGAIAFNYIPVGMVEKTVYFIIDDQKEEDALTQMTTANNSQVDIEIPKQAHGRHKLEVYFKCEIDGETIQSNSLIYDLICIEEGNNTPIIASAFSVDTIKQYSTVTIPWIAYSPDSLTTEVTITDNFGLSTTLTVDRTLQSLSYKAENYNTSDEKTQISFIVNEKVKKVISFFVSEYTVKPAVTNALELYLTAKGRSNDDVINRSKWEYGNIKADLQEFNFKSDGWLPDKNGDIVLRVTGKARVEIPFEIFGTDFRTTGKTIEFEFATRDILNPNTTVISCWSKEDNRGLKITAQEALIKSQQSEISRQYKEDEHVRVSFVVEKQNENRLLHLYINGIESGCVQYGSEDNFLQSSPVGIFIGSDFCTTDIYCIRIYRNNLTRFNMLNNWIADTQNIDELVKRAERNAVFDQFDSLDFTAIQSKNIPCFVVYAKDYSELPDHKALDGEPKKKISGKYVDPLRPEKSFTFEDAEMDVQGTSSQWYERKNYKFKFKKGFIVNNVPKTTYALRDTSIPTDVFTFKTDFASSEGANNVELAMLYNEVNPEKTPPQLIDSRVRQGIEGYPCLMFYYNEDESTYHFIGKYNFNNDKGTEEVFGFSVGDESWEILNNNDPTGLGAWKDDDYSDEKWKAAFEARYPEDNTDVTNLQTFASWLKSTDTTVVNTEEEKKARIDKFRNEFSTYVNVDAMIFNYVFTEAFLMVDNRRKNAFPTKYVGDKGWIILPYDFDTAIGINNNGELKFGYSYEDIDYVNGNRLVLAEDVVEEDLISGKTTPVFNGQDSVLYVNMRLAFSDKIKQMYLTMRDNPAFSYEKIRERFEKHQEVWGEAVFNEDSYFKYIEPLITKGTNDLKMLQGSKASQREWWLYNRFRYLDSKYNTNDSRNDVITFYAYSKQDLEVTPYADIYAAAEFDSGFSSVRALRGNDETPKTYTITNPTYSVVGEPAIDQVVAIFSASQLSDIGDLSKFNIGRNDFSKGVKLNRLKVGDGVIKNTHLSSLTVGNLPLLTSLDVRNCTVLKQVVDVSKCPNIKEVLAEGSITTGVTLPNGGVLETLHLPSTVTSLVILNQKLLKNFSIENNDFSNIETLRLEGVNYDLFDFIEILNEIKPKSNVRLRGIEITLGTAEEIFDFYDRLDAKEFKGIDENNIIVNKAVIEGTIHTGTITGAELLQMQMRYPYITIDFEHITSNVYFYVEDELVHTAIVYDGTDCYDPVEENIIDVPIKPETETTKYKFEGWVDAYGQPDDLTKVTADRTVYAEFSEHTKYIATFYNGDTLLSQVSYIKGENIVIPDTPTKESTDQYSYTFVGWSLDGLNVVEVPEIMGEENLTYYAVYTSILRQYTITFIGYTDFDGVNKEEIEYTLDYGTDLTPYIPQIEREGYNLINWSPQIIQEVSSNITYNAVYEKKKFTITWFYAGFSPIIEEWEYNEVPIPPYKKGEEVVIDGVIYTIKNFDKEIVKAVSNQEYFIQVDAKYVLNLDSVGVENKQTSRLTILNGSSFTGYHEGGKDIASINFDILTNKILNSAYQIKQIKFKFTLRTENEYSPRMFRIGDRMSGYSKEWGTSMSINTNYNFEHTFDISSFVYDSTNNCYKFRIYSESNSNKFIDGNIYYTNFSIELFTESENNT